jgi:outer membrane cobalamin receptor
MDCGLVRSHRPWLARTLAAATVVAVLLLGSVSSSQAQDRINVSGVVRDVSGGVIAGATLEAVVGERVIARATTGANGAYEFQVPARTPFALRTRRSGFADDVVPLESANGSISHDVTLSVGTMSDTLVVTASRGLESRASATQSLSVVGRSDIQALGSTELADVLRFVPGTSVEGTGREGGGPTSLFVRGGDSDYNVVLVDGVRANLDGGRFDFSRIAAGEIERVEVLRGAQSSLWGADAMTSVVQIITKRTSATGAPEISGSFEGGSFSTFRGNAGVYGGTGTKIDYHAAVTSRATDGAFSDVLPEDDRYTQTAFDGGLGLAIGSSASARGGVRYSDGNGKSVGPITYGARDRGTAYQTRDLTVFGAASHVLGSKFTGTGTVNYFRYRGRSADTISDPFSTYAILTGTPNAMYPNGTRLVRLLDANEFNAIVAAGALPAPGQFLASAQTSDFLSNPMTEVTRFRRPAIRYQGDYNWQPGQRLSVGYEWEREINPGVTGFNLDNNSVFVQYQSTFADRWFLTAGARVDSKESYDTYISPKLSAGGFILPYRSASLSSVKIFANIGRGVKSPTFTERFGGTGFADPNPNIRVEQAKSGDAGIETTFVDQTLRATAIYFRNTFTDQISYRFGPTGDGIPEFINIDGSKASGLELEFALQRPLAGVTAVGTYSYVHTEVVTNQSTSQQFQPGHPLLRRPRHSGSFRAAYAKGRATVNFSLRMIRDRFDSSFLSLRTVPNAERPSAITTDITINPGYVVAALGFDFKVHNALTAYVRGDNLGDTLYDSALGYPGLPRAVVVGARFRFATR